MIKSCAFFHYAIGFILYSKIEYDFIKVKILNRKALEKGEQKPTRDEVNELLRSPVRARRHVTSWGHGDSPRNQWLRKMNIYDDSGSGSSKGRGNNCAPALFYPPKTTRCLTKSPKCGRTSTQPIRWALPFIQAGSNGEHSLATIFKSPAAEAKNFYYRNIELDECLFCGVISSSFDQNLGHMSDKHDFRFPDEEFVVSPEELFFFCADKVGNGNICLVCNYAGRAFYSLQVFKLLRDETIL